MFTGEALVVRYHVLGGVQAPGETASAQEGPDGGEGSGFDAMRPLHVLKL